MSERLCLSLFSVQFCRAANNSEQEIKRKKKSTPTTPENYKMPIEKRMLSTDLHCVRNKTTANPKQIFVFSIEQAFSRNKTAANFEKNAHLVEKVVLNCG